MLTEERQRKISEWVNQVGTATVKELSQRFEVSEMTIWRDLKILDQKRLISRVRGGAFSLTNGTSIDQAQEPQFELKQEVYREEKIRIAKYAAAHCVEDGDIITLEGGTTVASMVSNLKHSELTILTNGLAILNLAANYLPTLTLMGCGGILRDVSRTFVGPQAEAFFAEFRVRKLFISATGLTLEDGLTDPNPLEVQVKRAMHKSAQTTILLLDSSKLGKRSLTPVMSLSEIDILITDENAPVAVIEDLRNLGIEVHIAS